MTKKWQSMFDKAVGVNPVNINSALVSAQNRKRLYWTNLGDKIQQPRDKHIYLKDIIEHRSVEEHYFVGKNLRDGYSGGNQLNPLYKSQANTVHDLNGKCFTLCAGTHGYANGHIPVKKYPLSFRANPKFSADGLCRIANAGIKGNDSIKRLTFQRSVPSLNQPIDLTTKENHNRVLLCAAMRGRYLVDGKRKDAPVGSSNAGRTRQYFEVRHDYKTNCITTVQKDNNIVFIEITDHKNQKVRHNVNELDWRKLTPIECERLQTVNDNYTAKGLDEKFKEIKISNTQRYKMLGNGWTVDIIVHILEQLLKINEKNIVQESVQKSA